MSIVDSSDWIFSSLFFCFPFSHWMGPGHPRANGMMSRCFSVSLNIQTHNDDSRVSFSGKLYTICLLHFHWSHYQNRRLNSFFVLCTTRNRQMSWTYYYMGLLLLNKRWLWFSFSYRFPLFTWLAGSSAFSVLYTEFILRTNSKKYRNWTVCIKK